MSPHGHAIRCHPFPTDAAALTPPEVVAVFGEWGQPTIDLEREGETLRLRRPRSDAERLKLEAVVRKVLVGEVLHVCCSDCGRVTEVEVAHG